MRVEAGAVGQQVHVRVVDRGRGIHRRDRERIFQPFQRLGDGSSDGGWMERSGYPIDWVFVGAPQKASHTPAEEVDARDLRGMADLTTALVDGL